jgi:DHA3 family macrolide efflux protein-like MFS transporter
MMSASGLTTFVIVWLGQVVSVVGSGLTSFALGVWVFERSGSATQFALIGLSAVLPRVLLSPLAGTIADRWDRRRVMILSDAGAGLSTLVLVVLLSANRLETWHIYLLAGASAAFSTFQFPAYSAVTTLLVPEQQLGRANGLIQFGQAAAEILAHTLAGTLMLSIGLRGVILIDVTSFLCAVLTLLAVQFPSPPTMTENSTVPDSLREDLATGWRYISQRPGLRGLLVFTALVNFLWGMVGALIAPMILGFASSDVLGIVISTAGAGLLTGSLLMSIWGGPKRRINGVLCFEFLSGLCFMLIGLRPSFWPTALGAFGAHLTIAIVFGSNQAIWQSRVAAELQGRVFATQQMMARSAAPLAYLLAGPLAERVFEPMLRPGGALAGSAGQILGSGPGRGIGLLFILMGAIKLLITLAGFLNPAVRFIEEN